MPRANDQSHIAPEKVFIRNGIVVRMIGLLVRDEVKAAVTTKVIANMSASSLGSHL